MDIIIGFLLSFLLLIYGVIRGIYIGYCLFISFLIFFFIAIKQGNKPRLLLHKAWQGGQKALVVLRIFLLIGLVTASWLSAGTIPAIVYYSVKVMKAELFLVFAFLISSLVSYMLGTSFGTASTIGLVLIIMARSGKINLNLVGGAILSGCYFGDRASPMSSSANLISNLTEAELYSMLKNFLKTTILPFILTSLIYLFLSLSNPLKLSDSQIVIDLQNNFTINYFILIPALAMLVLSLFQIRVRSSMLVSIVLGSIISILVQGNSLANLTKTLIFGYRLKANNPLANILKGGGLISMLQPAFIVFVSCSMTGILEAIGLFEMVDKIFNNIKKRWQLFSATALVSFFAAAFGGNQSIAVVMTSQIMKDIYERHKVDKYGLATDISNTTILFAPMIPWNIANLVPATTLSVNPAKIVPYAFYLYLPFLINWLYFWQGERNS